MAEKRRKSNSSKSYFLPLPQLEDLLKSVGVVVAASTATDLIAYCPFHSNRDSPAFNVSLGPNHLWKCHNGKCAKSGNIISLLTLKGYSRSEAEKMVVKGTVEVDDLLALITGIMEDKKDDAAEEWHGVSASKFRDYDESSGWPARDYMLSRGITQEAIDFFGIGYAPKKDMAVVPVYDERDQLCGVIGRELATKRYQYSTGLNRGKLIWNINNARQYDGIILTEGALDAVYLWQAGYKSVGAVLGSAISPMQWRQLRKYFTEIVCFFDNDDAGKALTESVLEQVSDLEVSIVEYPSRMIEIEHPSKELLSCPDESVLYRPIKDPGELEHWEIEAMMDSRKTKLQLLLEQ